MMLRRQGDRFTYELNDRDLVALTRNLLDRHRRATIRRWSDRKFIGRIEFTTMQFKPFDYEKAGLDPVELADEEHVFMEVGPL